MEKLRTILSVFIKIFLLLLYINCIIVIRQPDDSHNRDQNMLAKNNNTWLNVFVNVRLLVCYISKQLVVVFFFAHNFPLPLFAPISIYILFISTCTVL